jgi:NADH pyrophosphatase NudC (nudix superfamily)
MLNYLIVAENGDIVLDTTEIDDASWFTFDDALKVVRKNSTAEAFLKNALAELKINKI